MKKIQLLFMIFVVQLVFAQHEEMNKKLDSLFIVEVEQKTEKLKILHAEPLFIDLIRDLGARKGEKEWNVGFGLVDNEGYDHYESLVEYEWAPVDRLGLEIELPFSFYTPHKGAVPNQVPESRLESLKLAAQYTFLVSGKWNTSMAVGYLHEFELTPFRRYRNSTFYQGNIFNPFLVTAKRWGNNFHTLLYQGPIWTRSFDGKHALFQYQVNTNLHYMISGTRNFIGLEINKDFYQKDFDMVLRPQMRVGINDQLMIGIVTGIPIERETQRISTFLRLIYEPKH